MSEISKEERQVKIESTRPIQSRIDIRTLAEMDQYWSNEGHYIKTISQLVAWTVDLCREILFNNDKLVSEPMGLSEALNYLGIRGLTQQSLVNRSMRKNHYTKGFEEIRLEGGNPRLENPSEFAKIHNRDNMEPMPVKKEETVRDEVEIAIMKAKIEKRKEEKERIKSQVEVDEDGYVKISPSNIGSITDEDLAKWKSSDSEENEDANKPDRKKIDVTGSLQLRKKTDAELELEGERITKKDVELEKQMNEIPDRSNVVKLDD